VWGNSLEASLAKGRGQGNPNPRELDKLSRYAGDANMRRMRGCVVKAHTKLSGDAEDNQWVGKLQGNTR